MRLGRRERLAKRATFQAWRDYKSSVIEANLKAPLPKRSVLSRDETQILKLNTHTRGIRVGYRKTKFVGPNHG